MSNVVQPGQRVAVLVDSQNLYHTTQSVYSRNIDYEELLDEAVAGRELTRAIAYVIRANSPNEENFFEALKRSASRPKSRRSRPTPTAPNRPTGTSA